MRIRSLLILFLLLVNMAFSYARQMGMEISYAQFMDEKNQGYMEMYFALAGQSIDYAQIHDNLFQGGARITVAIYKDSTTFVTGDKFRILSPELKDTINIPNVFINQIRLPLNKGHYTLKLDIRDINDTSEHYHYSQDITMNLGGNKPSTSSLVFLDSYSPAKENSNFSKSGYDLIPFVSTGDYYFNQNMKKLSFYIELYNIADSIGKDEPYLVKYYIENADNHQILNNYAGYAKKNAGKVQPLLATFPIEKLRTGNYNLVIKALDKKGKEITSASDFFYRDNPIEPIDIDSLETADLTGTFAFRIGSNIDTMYRYIRYLQPISNDAEKNYQKKLLDDHKLSEMRRYFYAFWVQHSPDDPQGAWEKYYENVKIANRAYGTTLRKGFLTDRGRVFLVYGKPNMVDSRKMEPGAPAYEIWHYGQINSPYAMRQTNKIFIFAEFQPSTNDYELFHSTAYGELQSRRWRYDMAQRYMGAGGNIDDDYTKDRDDFGTRTNNNMTIDATGAER